MPKNKALLSPFVNDPFALTCMAFGKLYPNTKCECWIDVKPNDWAEGDGYGYTEFYIDGNCPRVVVYADFPIMTQVEVLAHELAHVAVGSDHEHDDVWEAAFSAIHAEYEKIADEILGG